MKFLLLFPLYPFFYLHYFILFYLLKCVWSLPLKDNWPCCHLQRHDMLMPPSMLSGIPSSSFFSVHCFLKKNGELKQVPLAFALMSGQKKTDYKKVIKKIKDLLPTPPAVMKIVADFEVAI